MKAVFETQRMSNVDKMKNELQLKSWYDQVYWSHPRSRPYQTYRSFIEYLACGQPVAASDVPGDVQILKEIEAGLLYKPGDPKDLAEKVCAILRNPELAQQMADNGRPYVMAHGTWRHVTQRIMAIAEEIVASPTM